MISDKKDIDVNKNTPATPETDKPVKEQSDQPMKETMREDPKKLPTNRSAARPGR